MSDKTRGPKPPKTRGAKRGAKPAAAAIVDRRARADAEADADASSDQATARPGSSITAPNPEPNPAPNPEPSARQKKLRLDQLLVERELVATRARAQALIMAGEVFVRGQKITKAGHFVHDQEDAVEVRVQDHPYVSRGGLKLEAALRQFGFSCEGLVVIDVGASTGGFTDCCLQRGAARVYAVDVGYGQLAWRLRQDERVINLERANIRTLEPSLIPEPCALAVIDCSFISLDKVLPPTLRFLAPEAHVLALIKPQFEVGQAGLSRGGVVRDQDARQRAIDEVVAQAKALGLRLLQSMDCPVHGPAGNVEHLALFAWSALASAGQPPEPA